MRAHIPLNLRVSCGLPGSCDSRFVRFPRYPRTVSLEAALMEYVGSNTEVPNSAFGPNLEFYDPSVHGGTPNCANVVGQRA